MASTTLLPTLQAPRDIRDLACELRPRASNAPPVKFTLGQVPTFAATLTEQLGSGASIVIPDVHPQVFAALPRATVASLMPEIPITVGNSVHTFTENSTPTTGGAAIPEGSALDPLQQTEIVFAGALEPVQVVGALLPITLEMLEDGGAFQQFLRRRLIAELDVDEDAQLLWGSTDAGQIVGIANRVGLQTTVTQGAPPNNIPGNLAAIKAARHQIIKHSREEPDAVVMHPLVWERIEDSTDAMGAVLIPPTLPRDARSLYGMRVVTTRALGTGTAVVGCFGIGGAVLRKGGTTIEISASHDDWFTKGLYAMRATRRVGLAVTLPGGFGVVSNLDLGA